MTVPVFLCDADKTKLARQGKILIKLYNLLSVEALNAGIRMWKMTGKFHMFIHLCDIQLGLGNPRTFWTYSDEDLQHLVKEVALSCHPITVCFMTLYKWVIFNFDDD